MEAINTISIQPQTVQEAIEIMRNIAERNGKTPVYLVMTNTLSMRLWCELKGLGWPEGQSEYSDISEHNGLRIIRVDGPYNYLELGY